MTDTVGQEASPASEYLRIIWRRKWIIGLIAVLMIVGAVSAALLLPANYQSTATILIEEPVVSDELSRTADVAFADQRLQLIQQRVMTTARLIEAIEKLGLYREARETTPLNVLADNMRTLIDLSLVDLGMASAGIPVTTEPQRLSLCPSRAEARKARRRSRRSWSISIWRRMSAPSAIVPSAAPAFFHRS